MSIIRGVEVDIENQLDNFKASHKEERGKLKYWAGKAAEAAKQIEERDGGWGAALQATDRGAAGIVSAFRRGWGEPQAAHSRRF